MQANGQGGAIVQRHLPRRGDRGGGRYVDSRVQGRREDTLTGGLSQEVGRARHPAYKRGAAGQSSPHEHPPEDSVRAIATMTCAGWEPEEIAEAISWVISPAAGS